MLHASVGLAHGEDSYATGVNACQDAFSQLKGMVPNAVLVFASARYVQEQVLAGVRSVSGAALLVGCSTAGEITGAGPATRNAVVVAALASPDVKFYAGAGENIAGDARAAGRAAAYAIKSQTNDPVSFLALFPDVLAGSGSEILRGVADALGDKALLSGGAPGDEFQFQKTFQYLSERVLSGAVAALGVVGPLKVGIGAGQGWIPIGLPMEVTRAAGAVLHELDGKPAASVYEDYFGSDLMAELKTEGTFARVAVTYPLGIKIADSGERLVRNALKVNPDGSLTFTAEIAEGSQVQLMLGSREDAVKAAREAAERAVSELQGTPKVAFVWSAASRSRLFGEHGSEEIEAIKSVVGSSVPVAGFYTYGECVSAARGREGGRAPVFYNETVVVTVLGD